ncbi:hypothetical protein GGI43DRAFT_416564 [Trichoderma evansii]
MIQQFGTANAEISNLLSKYPPLANPSNHAYKISPIFLEKFNKFNQDHLTTHKRLGRIKNGIYFVNGCPGAGKTKWNMVISELIQSHRSPAKKRVRHQILLLINQTVSDAADRYHCLCKAAGLDVRIIRIHGI